MPCFMVVGETDEERRRWREMARMQVAFYGSTPNYAFVFDQIGFDGTTTRIREKQKAGDMPEMAQVISDEILEHFTVSGTWDEMPAKIAQRYDGVASRVVSYFAGIDPSAPHRWGSHRPRDPLNSRILPRTTMDERARRIEALKQEIVGGMLLSAAEAGEILDVHQRTILDYIRDGRLRALQIGGNWKIPEQALREFVEKAKNRPGLQEVLQAWRERAVDELPKLSPFEATRWNERSYEVQVGGEWYELQSIDGHAIEDVVRFCTARWGDKWEKRLDEDLVEVLARMPNRTASVALRSLDGEVHRSLDGVPMTNENRTAIWFQRNKRS